MGKFLIDPFNIFWILLFVTFLAGFLKQKYLFKMLGVFTIVWFLIISTPFFPNLLLNSLEDQYKPISISQLKAFDGQYHIIVLGGGHGYDDRLPANALLSENALGRLNEAIRLYYKLPKSKLVLSGNTAAVGEATQAQMLQQAAVLLDVNKRRLILQNEPGNTFEEAAVYAENYGNTHPIILVTSAAHMPRAMVAFKHFNISPLASPTNFRLKGSWKNKWIGLPSLTNIENMRIGIYEYIAINWYRLKYFN